MRNEDKAKDQLLAELKTHTDSGAKSECSETQGKGAEETLDNSERRYRLLAENVTDVIWTLDMNLQYTYVSPTVERLRGHTVEEVMAQTLEEVLTPASFEMAMGALEETLRREKTGEIGPFESTALELELRRKDGSTVWTEARMSFLRDPDGRPVGILGVTRDISERKKAEDALREKNEILDAILTASPIGIGLVRNRVLDWANQAMYSMVGYYEENGLTGKNASVLYPDNEEYERVGRELYTQITESGSGHLDTRWVRKDGTIFDCHLEAQALDSSDLSRGQIVAVMDITERKRAENALQESEKRLHLLSSHLLDAQEKERRRISRELHDGLGQALIGLKYNLRSIERKLRKDQPKLRGECEYALRYIDEIIDDVRRMSRGLSPYILEDLGLLASLRWMMENFSERHKVQVSVDLANIDHFFSEKTQTIIYRIFQEILTNIAKHAHATRVSVAAREKGGAVCFLVEDDGSGFDMKEQRMRNSVEKGMGLTAIEERTWMVGGSLDIWSQPGKGTRIGFTVPVDREGT
jgi:PAS domain S-box-containing protein